MRLYRVHKYDTAEGSFGYEWFSTKREAEAAKRAFEKDYESSDHGVGEIDCFVFDATKRGILDLLARVATYPNNG